MNKPMSVSASRIVSLCPNKITGDSKKCSFGYFLDGRSYNSLLGSVSSRNRLKLNIVRKSKTDSAAAEAEVSSSEKMVYDLASKQAALFDKRKSGFGSRDEPEIVLPGNSSSLSQAYDLCSQNALKDKDSTFYIGTLLMPPEKRKAFWAIAVWCRRTDELVDGPNASQITPSDLDNWESRLERIFEGRPLDLFDAALSDTVARFHVDIQPFKDMIEGMRMDLWKSRYKNFDELYLYCYRVAGAVGLITVPIMGIAPESEATTESVLRSALALGTANQLTNILRDVGEDAERGRVYLPQDELAQAGLSDDDIFAGKVTDKWRSFMKQQIKRARMYFDEAERGLPNLNANCRWAVWASVVLYRQILEKIEANDYNNFTKKASLSNPRKILALPIAYAKSFVGPSST